MALSPLTQAGLPEPIAALLVSFERSAARGQLAVAPGAVRALLRPNRPACVSSSRSSAPPGSPEGCAQNETPGGKTRPSVTSHISLRVPQPGSTGAVSALVSYSQPTRRSDVESSVSGGSYE